MGDMLSWEQRVFNKRFGFTLLQKFLNTVVCQLEKLFDNQSSCDQVTIDS